MKYIEMQKTQNVSIQGQLSYAGKKRTVVHFLALPLCRTGIMSNVSPALDKITVQPRGNFMVLTVHLFTWAVGGGNL